MLIFLLTNYFFFIFDHTISYVSVFHSAKFQISFHEIHVCNQATLKPWQKQSYEWNSILFPVCLASFRKLHFTNVRFIDIATSWLKSLAIANRSHVGNTVLEPSFDIYIMVIYHILNLRLCYYTNWSFHVKQRLLF